MEFLSCTGFQLAVLSMVTSSNSVFPKLVNILQIYWSISKPSNNAALLEGEQNQQLISVRLQVIEANFTCLESQLLPTHSLSLNHVYIKLTGSFCSTPLKDG